MKRFLSFPLLVGLLLLWSCDLTLPQYTEEPFDWEGYEAGDSGGSTEPNSDVSQGGQSSVDVEDGGSETDSTPVTPDADDDDDDAGDDDDDAGGDDDGDDDDGGGGGGSGSDCLDDSYEDNDMGGAATVVSAGTVNSLRSCPGDPDYFRITVAQGQTFSVDVLFTHAEGDIDVAVDNGAGVQLGNSGSNTDNESVGPLLVTTAGDAYIAVNLWEDHGADPGNSYTLQISITGGGGDDDDGDDDDGDDDDDDDVGDDDDDDAGDDLDGDGYSVLGGDCDDNDSSSYPGAAETCDGADNNCNTTIDEGTSCYDDDGDGQSEDEGDCDDNNNLVYTGATEVCDTYDNDCNSQVDDGLDCSADNDGDNYSVNAGDCDDNNSAVNPAATEICDGINNNCAAGIDEGFDTDSDGVTSCGPDGVPGNADDDCEDSSAAHSASSYPGAAELCDGYDNDCDGNVPATESDDEPDGWMVCEGDCNDSDSSVYPGAPEQCDNIDSDCDTSLVDGTGTATFADLDSDGTPDCVDSDADGDGFHHPADCDDSDAAVNPSASEVCDGIDNDCVGGVDDGIGATWYADWDGDFYGDPTSSVQACFQPSGMVSNPDDCDDFDHAINPAATEVCDGYDNNCAGGVDEGLTSPFYVDTDLDNYGNSNVAQVQACSLSSGLANVAGDCDDNNATVNPAASELCDGLDTDCAGGIPTNEADADGDSVMACAGDCNDGDNTAYPGATELCEDNVDNDCDSDADCNDSDCASFPLCVVDDDGDGHSPPADCDDGDDTVHPGATEVCDGADNDCNTLVDEGFDGDGDGVTSCGGDCDDANASLGAQATDGDCDGSLTSVDCNDANSAVYPGATEICGDNLDNNCAGGVDEGCTEVCSDAVDNDGDGQVDCNDSDCASDPSCPGNVDADQDGFSANTGDCDDSNGAVHPGAVEFCDGVDNDCDGGIDNNAVDAWAWYSDSDGDGFGDAFGSPVLACNPPAGHVSVPIDCDDNNPLVNPGMLENCVNGIDDNCDTQIDEWPCLP